MVLDSTMRSLRVRLLLPLSLVVVVIFIGTAGYHALWLDVGGTWMDALFMTVTTITTIGYGEIKPLTTAGRLFTMGLAITGIGSMFYTLGVVMEYLVSVRLADPMGRRRMERRIRELSGHVIVAGMGRMEYRRFLTFNVFGGTLWVLSMTLIGYFLGQIPGVREHIEVVILVVVILSILPGIIAGAREWLKNRAEAKRPA